MDRADKFINNRTPRRQLVMLLVLLIIAAAAEFIIAGKIADRAAKRELDYYLLGAGGSPVTSELTDEALTAGEQSAGSGVTRSIPPRVMRDWKNIRTSAFWAMFAATAIPAVLYCAFAMSETSRLYDSMEEISAECAKAADDPDYKIALKGTGSECLRRVSEGVDLLAGRLAGVTGELNAERRYMSEFLGDFSHQIKTSLAVVRLNFDMIAETENLPPEQREKLAEEIQINLDGMESLVINAIKAARLDTDMIEYTMKPESLTATCKLALRRIGSLLRSKGITVRAELDEDITFLHDKGWMCEAIENILKNSADHSGCTEIYAAAERDPIMTKLILEDNGIGIEQGEIPHLFDRFARRSADRTMRSAGMGMSIAQKVIRSHGGEIYVYSGRGSGTRFEIVFLNK